MISSGHILEESATFLHVLQLNGGQGVISQGEQIVIRAGTKYNLFAPVVNVLIQGPITFRDDDGRSFVIESKFNQIWDISSSYKCGTFTVDMLIDETCWNNGKLNRYGVGHFWLLLTCRDKKLILLLVAHGKIIQQ